jgi:TRAP transporter solute receptor, dctP family
MKLSRRRVLLGTAASLALPAVTACGGRSSSGKTWKLAFNQTAEHPQFKAAEALGKRLAEATNNRYSIDVYPNEQLGSQNQVVQNLSNGTVEMMYIGGPVMEGFNKDFIVFNLPYIFDSIQAQSAVFADESVMGGLFTSIEESKNITVLAALHAGVRNVYNNKRAIRTPADLSGLKIRVQQSDSQVAMIQGMGAIGSPMGQGEVYGALQSGVLDGAENNETVYDALKHDEVAKFYSYTRHLMIPDYLLINTKTLKEMSAEDQAAFRKLIPEMRRMADDGFVDFVKTSKENAEKLGAKFNDDCDMTAFKSSVEELVKKSIDNPVRQRLYEAAQDANKKFPAIK